MKPANEETARRANLKALRQSGWNYPNDFRPEQSAAQLQAQGAGTARTAGRMMSRRIMGKAAFAHLQDFTGRIQLHLRRDHLGKLYDDFKCWDVGDIIGVAGTLFRTRTDELTIQVGELHLLSKSLRPLPEKYHGLTDREQRYRRRYLDLLVNADTRRTFALRSRTIRFLRSFLERHHYDEVETPMMHAIPGGATARPFVTRHHSLDIDLYLRIAPELYLKRLLVGGMERVFELNRNFRNEGLSTRHNPEFTMLELYQAYADCRDMMTFIEKMLRELLVALTGKPVLHVGAGEHDLSRPIRRMTLREALREAGVERCAEENAYAAFEKQVEPRLQEPTFITPYPLERSPLARQCEDHPGLADRFELFAGGLELANGFSELNDPEEQEARLRRQAGAHYDADFITALEYGMPPAAGAGIGIDRLVMLLAGAGAIRDAILFPLLRPRNDP